MNHTVEMTSSDSFFKKQIASRVLMIAGGIPLEVLAMAQNLIKLPFEAATAAIKLPSKVANFCLRSKTLKEFERGLSGPFDVIKTALKVVGYAIGTSFTATFGFFSPSMNFKLHVKMHLIRNEKAETKRLHAETEAARLRDAQEKSMQAHIQNLVFAMRLQVAEKERKIAQEAEKRKEEQDVVYHEAKLEKSEGSIQQADLESEEVRLRQAVEEAISKKIKEDSLKAAEATPEENSLKLAKPVSDKTLAEKSVEKVQDVDNFFSKWLPKKWKPA